MSTEIIMIEKIVLNSNDGDTVIFEGMSNDRIFVTNNDTDEFDATAFSFTIDKEDWPEIKSFIDKYFNA